MNCQRIEPELVAYHFGTVDEETRREVQEHLSTCQACLHSFFSIKAEIETAPQGPRPSAAARARLRRAVAREIGAEQELRPWSWWERPIAFGFAAAAVLASVFAMRVVTSGAGSLPRTMHLNPSYQAPAPPPSR